MWSLLGWLQAVAKLGAWFTGWLDRRRIKKYVKNELLVKQLAEMEERRLIVIRLIFFYFHAY